MEARPIQHSSMTDNVDVSASLLPAEVWIHILSFFNWTEFLRLTTSAHTRTTLDDEEDKGVEPECWSHFRSIPSLAVQCMVNSMCEEIGCKSIDRSWLVERLFAVTPASSVMVEYLLSMVGRHSREWDDVRRAECFRLFMETLVSNLSESSWIELEPFFERNASYVV